MSNLINVKQIKSGNDGYVLTSTGSTSSWLPLSGFTSLDGIYGGSGTVPTSVNVALTDTLTFDTNTLKLYGASNRVGVGITGTPVTTLEVGGIITISDPGIGNVSRINFDKSSDSAMINVTEYASDSTLYEFFMSDNPDTTNDIFHWAIRDWQQDSSGWKPLKLAGLQAQFVAENTDFWSSLRVPSSTAYFTTNIWTDVDKFQPYISNSYALGLDSGTGTGSTFNVEISTFSGTTDRVYWVEIDDAVGGTFSWGVGPSATVTATGVTITGGFQTLDQGTQIKITGAYALADHWSFRAFPAPKITFGDITSPTEFFTVEGTSEFQDDVTFNTDQNTLGVMYSAGTDISLLWGGAFTHAASGRITPTNVYGNTVTSNYSTIAGGSGNTATGAVFQTIGGGKDNTIDSNYSSILGGNGNVIVGALQSVIVGGHFNRLSGNTSFIGGGYNNDINTISNYSFIGGGGGNKILGASAAGYGDRIATIAGGYGNEIVGALVNSTVIVGGAYNKIGNGTTGGTQSFIGGGSRNMLTLSERGVIVGGRYNTLSGGDYSSIVGGSGNSITGAISFIGGGSANTINTTGKKTAPIIVGGRNNEISGYQYGSGNFIGGGGNLTTGNKIIGGGGNVIVGGSPYNSNVISGNTYQAFIGTGDGNIVTENYSSVLNGLNNKVLGGTYTLIGGGRDNTIGGGNHSSIVGGKGNTISGTTNYSTIAGGQTNEISDSAKWSFIGAGKGNEINGFGYSNINSGRNNLISDGGYNNIGSGKGNQITVSNVFGTSIGGGHYNRASAYRSFIGGGAYNKIGGGLQPSSPTDGRHSFLGGGKNNKLYNSYSVIGGGELNQIGSPSDANTIKHNTIGGGNENTISVYDTNTIGGGSDNTITTWAGTIGGGSGNKIYLYSWGATIGGGQSNIIHTGSYYSFIGGGNGNVIQTGFTYSSIVGGQSNVVNHSGAHIIGSNITSVSANTTHVERLNIGTTTTGSSSTDILVVEGNGMVNTITVGSITGDTFISGMTFNGGTYDLTIDRNDGTSFTESLSILASDMVVTGGTYDIGTGIVEFTNNSGGTFEVSGFTSGMTDSYTTTAYTTGDVVHFDNNIQGSDVYEVDLTPIISGFTSTDYFVTGFTYNNSNLFTVSVSDGNDYTALINTMSGLTIDGDLTVNGQSVFSGNTDVVTIYGSGTTAPVFSILGSSGELFSVSDDLIGDIFSVNDISGIPIITVNSDEVVTVDGSLVMNTEITSGITGTTTCATIDSTLGNAAYFDYYVMSGETMRMGTVMTVWNSTSVQYTDTSTPDLGGDTSVVSFSASTGGGNVNLIAIVDSGTWVVKTGTRII